MTKKTKSVENMENGTVKSWAKATHAVAALDFWQMSKANHHIDSISNILLNALVSSGMNKTDYARNKNALILKAAYLHDIVEDTPIPLAAIESMFGTRVAELVGLLTEDSSKTRRERQADAYSKINKDHDATLIKLADRISNIEYTLWGLRNTHFDWSVGIDREPTSEETKTAMKKAKMYLKEYAFFKEMLRYEVEDTSAPFYVLWAQLDNLMELLGKVMEND